MKCTKNLILSGKGVLLFNCDLAGNTFAGMPLASYTLTDLNTDIADGKLIYLPFLNSPDALSANNEDGTNATDGYDTVQVNSARIGINAMLSSRFGTIVSAVRASGATQGYLVTRDGFIIGAPSADGATLNMVEVSLSAPSPMPNGAFAGSSNLPNVQVTINFGSVEDVAEWRVRTLTGMSSPEEILELEEADAIVTGADTADLIDFAGNKISGANDLTNANFTYSATYSGTPTISNGTMTFASITPGTTVTVNGSVSGYKVFKSFAF